MKLTAALAASAALMVLLVTAGVANAATSLTVNSTADGPPVKGDCVTPGATCTLRDAVDVVNSTTPAADFTITLPAGRILLTQGELAVTGNESGTTVTIAGAGARSTIVDGGGKSRVFDQQSGGAAKGSLALTDLTITGGVAGPTTTPTAGDGGGILLGGAGTLTLTRVAIVGNTATFGGGGIDAAFESTPSPQVNITDSTIAGNTVAGGSGNGQGGGMAVYGPLTIKNSTVTGNSVSDVGPNEGGGIVAAKPVFDPSPAPDPVTLVSTTIAGNSISGQPPSGTSDVGGGISGQTPPVLRLLHPQGVGPFSSELSAVNTIVAGNSVDGATEDCALLATGSTDHNLSSDSSCGFSDAGSHPSTANPRLGSLANNGGPTDTLALLTGSPAINAGTNSGCPSADQRGVPRPQQGVCDIGAFEYVPSADLQLTASGTPLSVTAGGDLTYTLTVTDNGPDPATGVVLADPLPAGVTLLSVRASQGGCAATTCSLGSLAPGASATVTLVVRTSAPGTLTNTASVRGSEADPNLTNNVATVRNAVVAAAPARRLRPGVRVAAARCYRGAASLPITVTGRAAIASVRVLLDGRVIATSHKRHVSILISRLRRRRSTLTVVARARGGGSRTVRVTLRRCVTPAKPRFTG